MPLTNRDVKRVSRQLFASSRAIVTPFYNRVASRAEIEALFTDRQALRGAAVLISAPLGAGKTFFVDQVQQQVGVTSRTSPMLAAEVTEQALARERREIVFVDENDIKTDWASLQHSVETLGRFLADSGCTGLLLGDFVLRNPLLLQHLPEPRFLSSFEPLDEAFLRGVIGQRVAHYLEGKDARDGENLIEPGLYRVLVPEGMARVNSFRAVLSLLEQLAGDLPHNGDPCRLTVELAARRAMATFEPTFSTDNQAAFLNRLLDDLEGRHRGGAGLDQGYSKEELFLLGQRAGYTEWEAFQDEILEPFGDQGLLLSGGIPTLDERGHFARWVEPYYPSLTLRLLAEAPQE